MKVAVWERLAYEIPEWMLEFFTDSKSPIVTFRGSIIPEKRIEFAEWLIKNALPSPTTDKAELVHILRNNRETVYYLDEAGILDEGVVRKYYYYARGISDKKQLIPCLRIVETTSKCWNINGSWSKEFLTEYEISDVGYLIPVCDK